MHEAPLCELLWNWGLPEALVKDVIEVCSQDVDLRRLPSVWSHVSKTYLTCDVPFEVHQIVAKHLFQCWDVSTLGPPPLWYPTAQTAATANAAIFAAANRALLQLPVYSSLLRKDRSHTGLFGTVATAVEEWEQLHAASVCHPEPFWRAVLEVLGISFVQPFTRVVSHGSHPDVADWFPGARLNIAAAALQNPLRDLELPAIIFASEQHPTRTKIWTRRQLITRVGHIARSLVALGCSPRSRVALLGSMTPDAVATYLAIVWLGGSVVSIAESFTAKEMKRRLELSATSLIIVQERMARAGKELDLYAKVLALPRPRPSAVVFLADPTRAQCLSDGDIAWDAAMSAGAHAPHKEPFLAAADATTNVLFSSGTTGTPKMIPWTHITPIRAAVNAWSCHDVKSGEVYAWPSSLGWMMGPWLIYAALINGAALALFDGTPTGRPFGSFVAAAHVNILGVVPSIVRQWRASNCMAGLDWSSIRCFTSSGEASNADDYHWLMSRAGYKPVLEYCGGTEVGGAFCGGTMLHPCIPSAFATPTLGFQLFLLVPSEAATGSHRVATLPCSMSEREPGRGEVAVRAPALGMSQRLLNRNHWEEYYQGMPLLLAVDPSAPPQSLRRHGDAMEVLPGLGYFRALGRCDDTMNLGGIKVSSVEIERVCMEHVPEVAQAAAVSIAPASGGPEYLHVFLVLNSSGLEAPIAGQEPCNSTRPAKSVGVRLLKEACQTALRTHLNPLFKVSSVHVVDTLPHNASNKVMRRVLRVQLEAAASQRAKL